MAPLSNEIRPISSCTPPHIGPAIPEVGLQMINTFPSLTYLIRTHLDDILFSSFILR